MRVIFNCQDITARTALLAALPEASAIRINKASSGWNVHVTCTDVELDFVVKTVSGITYTFEG